MMTILLARSTNEAAEHARAAGLLSRNYIIATGILPGDGAKLDGIRLTEDDLVCEFPGFRQNMHSERVIEALRRSIRKTNDAGPKWVAITGAQAT